MKTKKLEFFILNTKVIPVVPKPEENYSRLLNNWYEKGFKIQTKGDNRHYYSIRELSKVEIDTVFYGIITKYVTLNDIKFYDTITGNLLEHPIPDNVEGRVNDYEFLFFPNYHRFAFIRIGKLNEEIDRTGAPLQKFREIVKIAFDNGLEPLSKTIVEIVQEDFFFEKIFENDLLSLDVRVSYTNDEANLEAKKLMHDLLEDGQIGNFFARLKPDNSGVINTEAKLPKGLLDLAKENGEVKARIIEDNKEVTIKSKDFPKTVPIQVEFQDRENLFNKFIQKIKGYFDSKYGQI